MSSYVVTGAVMHRRHVPAPYAFSYRTGWVLLDTRDLPALLERGWWCAWRRPGLVRYHRADYLAGADDLDTAVRDRVERATGQRPTGAVQVLTNLRMAGHCFNPVSFYFCRDADGTVRWIIAEITNTPWGERFAYVMGPDANQGSAADQRYGFAKAFHVSPFQPMGQRYAWRFRFSASRVAIHMVNHQAVDGAERPVFEAALTVALLPLTPARLARHVLSWPLMTMRIALAIYLQALRLWWMRVPFFTNPSTAARVQPEPA